nr:LOW QUALITY PROTEIN: uncharacterized protein C6orf223 homolog [Neomonachus schauinslandi]
MMPPAEAGAPAQGGGPAGTGLVRKEGADRGLFFTIRSPGAQAAYLAIPTLLKARASRSGETSGVLEDRKSRRFGQREQNRRRLGGASIPENLPALSAKIQDASICRRWRLPRQESFLHGLCRPLRPHPDLGESDSAEPASLHLPPHARRARRNDRIAGARLTRSNYPPPLSAAALCCARPTRPN